MRRGAEIRSATLLPLLWHLWLWVWLSLGLAGCEARGPERAFDRLRVAVGSRDARLLYQALDSDSRWAVQSIWDYQRKVARIVEARYPPGLRERELGRVAAAVRASSPAEFFAEVMAARGDPFAPLGGSVEALGSFVRREGQEVVTSTGLRVPMGAGPDGGWGYTAFHEELVRWRGAASNDLKRLEEDAERARP